MFLINTFFPRRFQHFPWYDSPGVCGVGNFPNILSDVPWDRLVRSSPRFVHSSCLFVSLLLEASCYQATRDACERGELTGGSRPRKRGC